MKKILICGFALLLLVSGCSKSYERDDSAGEVRYINYSDALKMKKENKTFLLMLTMPTCSHCRDMEEMLETYLTNHHVIVYNAAMIDDEGQEISTEEAQQIFSQFAGTPDINYIKKGIIEDHFSGYMSEDKFDEFVTDNQLDKKK